MKKMLINIQDKNIYKYIDDFVDRKDSELFRYGIPNNI